MQCWVYSILNRACRQKEADKIESLGPYAWILDTIISHGDAEKRRED